MSLRTQKLRQWCGTRRLSSRRRSVVLLLVAFSSCSPMRLNIAVRYITCTRASITCPSCFRHEVIHVASMRRYHELNVKPRHAHRCYDGSDQELWRSFYRPMYELPLRYHVHNGPNEMNQSEWHKVRLLHIIAGFRAVTHKYTPLFLRRQMRYF